MKAELTLLQTSVILGVSKRQVQRLIQSRELAATINGQGKRVIRREDLQALMGKREALAQVSEAPGAPHPADSAAPLRPQEHSVPNSGHTPAPEPSAPGAERPAHLRPAVEGGPLTNCPHPTSGNWPDPDVLRKYYEDEHKRMVEKLIGAPPHEYDDFQI